MQNENKISNAIATLYSNEMTEDGLKELRERFPSDLVIDMSIEHELKQGRKIRTEMNKLIGAITARKTTVNADIKSKADLLIMEVTKVYSPIVVPFEKQLIINKAAKLKAEKELKILLDGQRVKINELNGFIDSCIGQSSEFTSETIESVDSVEPSIFHKDIIHEVIETKTKVLDRLTELLTQKIAEEALEGERKKLAEKEAAIEEKNKTVELKLKTAELKLKAQERLNNLMMIPTTMLNESSKKIKHKIASISNFAIEESEFGELTDQAHVAVVNVCGQLKIILDNQVLVEKARESERVEEKSQNIEKVIVSSFVDHKELDNAIDNAANYGHGFIQDGKSIDPQKIYNEKLTTSVESADLSETKLSLKERFKDAQNEEPTPTIVDVLSFILLTINIENPKRNHFMECFGYLLMCDDSILIKEATNKLRNEFKDFFLNK